MDNAFGDGVGVLSALVIYRVWIYLVEFIGVRWVAFKRCYGWFCLIILRLDLQIMINCIDDLVKNVFLKWLWTDAGMKVMPVYLYRPVFV